METTTQESIHSYVSRYVVPFYFNIGGNRYEEICDFFSNNQCSYEGMNLPSDGKWIETGFWKNYKSTNNKQSEMDLYSYLPNIFDSTVNSRNEQNIGTSFVYSTTGKILTLKYINQGMNVLFSCSNLGVVLLKNGIGFIWYEVDFSGINIEGYVSFQNDFKELARTNDKKFGIKVGYDKDNKQDIIEPFNMGLWLTDIIESEKLGIRFWAERRVGQCGKERLIPDKALLYQYLFVDKSSTREINNLLFRIANGYDTKYNSSENLDDIYNPFGNIKYYLSKAGMSCVVENDHTNEAFFRGQFREKYVNDYFFIFILLSYQSFSCALYSKLLTELPADERIFEKNAQYIEALEDINGQINLFLVKSVFESVSNVHHQNGLYRYGKRMLCIEEDIQSLTIGLDALKNMEREKRDRKVDTALGVFGLLVVISAILDGLNLVDWFNNNNFDVWHLCVTGIILIPTIYLIFILVWNRTRK